MQRRKTRKSRVVDHQLLIFEIKEWEPSYTFAIDRDVEREGDYFEYVELHFDTICVYPDQFAGRTAKIIVSSRRELFEHRDRLPKPDGNPDSLGRLELRPSGGSFYAGIPHESLPFILSALVARKFRYMMLAGPSLKRSHSNTTELHFAQTAE